MHVDFFIAGVQKSGTTALDAMLRRHPAIEMASRKEPHFFDNETIDWDRPDYGILHNLYDSTKSGRARGEATPIYTYWPNSLERIKAYNPSAKLIVGLRHPAYRAFSHWRMETSRDAETLEFGKAIRDGRERVRAAGGGVHRVYSYVERGFYASQVARLHALFPREQVLYSRTDDLWLAPEETLGRIFAFIGVPQITLTSAQEYIVPVRGRTDLEFSRRDLDFLVDLFAADISQTALATGLDLSDWLSPDYAEPMVPK